jgi:hypothetical protein
MFVVYCNKNCHSTRLWCVFRLFGRYGITYFISYVIRWKKNGDISPGNEDFITACVYVLFGYIKDIQMGEICERIDQQRMCMKLKMFKMEI